MDEIFESLRIKLEQSGRSYDLERIQKAFEMASLAHSGQTRRSGGPYVRHPVAVAEILVELGLDTDSIIAALLHDVVEDTGTALSVIEKQFGSDVALLVDGVTKLGRVPLYTREEQQAENIRKMLLSMAKDIRVVLIKLADRLHNMRTVEGWTEQKRLEKALETMEIYAPLAHRLGIRTIKEELEDISLRVLDPVAYNEIEIALERRREEREAFLENIKKLIGERLSSVGVNVFIEGRVKSIYGIYRKIYQQGKSFDEIYDVYAVRVIVDTVNECYNILGIIHDMMRPIPGRFKDYISTPKSNLYQSLHTTVLSKDGIPFEVQIRTWEMHHTAEYGIAAHWKYKLGIAGKDNLDQKLEWVRQLLELQQEAKDAEDFMRTIKTDLNPDEVYVLTPRGDVINLPAGSTTIDFAYAIHSAVGNRMTGAKVNSKIEPITYNLQNGDIVEIITSSVQNRGPSRDWLKIVKTSEARNKIRAWFKKERRDENIVEGRAELEKEFRRSGILLDAGQFDEFTQSLARRQHFNSTDEMFAAIGYGGLVLSKIMPRVREEYQKAMQPVVLPPTDAPSVKQNAEGIVVEGIENCLVKLARCCSPLPGDRIIGFVTRGFGVSVHKFDCPNVVQNLKNDEYEGRWVRVHWTAGAGRNFKASLLITASDRYGLLADVTGALSTMHVMIHAATARELKTGDAAITLTIDADSSEQLQNVIAKLGKINGVYTVVRG
ncbi:MAG: bifunctional (p)ppGpp synthetase/guanosine-3',5'-bis(diphosphate) 3'-pyrophosphohydrolase [Clostridia bacterium]|nr:bifunctional (p)ppGpp synthetase/guanosine-3',5'-bis(diphosphate) 3'-pyrophosphohydrolase [Clostridia bacterium]